MHIRTPLSILFKVFRLSIAVCAVCMYVYVQNTNRTGAPFISFAISPDFFSTSSSSASSSSSRTRPGADLPSAKILWRMLWLVPCVLLPIGTRRPCKTCLLRLLSFPDAFFLITLFFAFVFFFFLNGYI